MNPLRFISENRMLISIVSVILLVIFLVLGQSFILFILIVASVILSYMMGVWHIKGIGIELVLLSSIISGMMYGPIAGAVVALLLITIHMLSTQHVNVYLLWVIPAYAVAGYLAGTTSMDIKQFGLFATLGLNAFNLLITALIFRANVGKFLPFAITNVLFNSVLFLFIAPGIMNAIS